VPVSDLAQRLEGPRRTKVVRAHDFAKRVRVALASALADERRFVEATGPFWRDGFSNTTVALALF
jgi:hypothetical protein